MRPQPRALTIAGIGLLRELRTDIRVATPVIDTSQPPDKITGNVSAIWDTGATGSVITQGVVDTLGIQPITMTTVYGVGGEKQSPVYLVDFHLPMQVGIRALNVTLGELVGADVLIGMDVILLGDFAVTNHGGRTKMTFRLPSMAEIDFVREASNPPNRAARRAQEKQRPKRR